MSKVMNPDVYEVRSLEQTINDISDSKVTLTYEKIVNLVVKYFFAYRYPETSDISVHLKDIENLVWELEKFYQVFKTHSWKRYELPAWEDAATFGFFCAYTYPVWMLSDFASTSIIVRQIVAAIIDRESFDWNYLSLDVWTWTGILSLATFINSRRNNFWKTTLIGVDNHRDSLDRTQELLWKVSDGTFMWVPYDTRDSSQMEKLLDPKGKLKFTYVVNENITTTWIPMWVWPDPFHQNNRVIFGALSPMVWEATMFFPSRIKMLFSTDGWKTGTEFVGDAKNHYEIERLGTVEKHMCLENKEILPDGWNIFKNVYPRGIEINWKFIPPHLIGKELYDKGVLLIWPKRFQRWTS